MYYIVSFVTWLRGKGDFPPISQLFQDLTRDRLVFAELPEGHWRKVNGWVKFSHKYLSAFYTKDKGLGDGAVTETVALHPRRYRGAFVVGFRDDEVTSVLVNGRNWDPSRLNGYYKTFAFATLFAIRAAVEEHNRHP